MGGITPTPTTGGIANASSVDIAFMKNANDKIKTSPEETAPVGISGIHTSLGGIKMTGGSVALEFNNPRIITFISTKGIGTFTYTNHSLQTDLGYGGWRGDQNKYTINASYYTKVSPTISEACTTCFYIEYNLMPYRIREEKKPTTSFALIADMSNPTILNASLLESSTDGYTLTLSNEGAYTVNLSALTLTAFGPFSLEKDGRTYILTNKTPLPVEITNLSIIQMDIQNMQGELIGEAEISANGTLNFKLYVNNLLTPVSSL